MTDPEALLLEVKAALRRLVIATVTVGVALALLGVYVYTSGTAQRNEVKRVAVQSNAALCTLRADLEQRVRDSRRFLRNHPKGVAGISPEDIQRSIDGQQRTIDALGILDCKEVPT